MSTDFNSQIEAELVGLGPDAQRRVLEYVRAVKRGDAGTRGTDLTMFAGTIPLDELQLIQTAIENGCEQVDLNEW